MKALKGFSVFVFFVLLNMPTAFCDEPENLLGISFNFDKSEITIKVVTTGCTQKDDFTIEFKDNKLTVIRKKRDTCKMMPSETSFTYSIKEFGINQNTPFTITNKFIVNYNLANIK